MSKVEVIAILHRYKVFCRVYRRQCILLKLNYHTEHKRDNAFMIVHESQNIAVNGFITGSFNI